VNRSRNTIIILSIVLVAILITYFVFFDSEKNRFQWNPTYRAESDQPYGTLFIRNLLESYRPGGKFVYNKNKPLHEILDDASVKKGTDYIFIGESVYLDQQDLEALVNFVSNGNDAFIASLVPPTDLINRIHKKECDVDITYENNFASSVTFNFYHNSLRTKFGYKYAYRYRNENESFYWNYFSPAVFCDSTKQITPLAYQEKGGVNFIKIAYGEGNIYIHSNPLAFTNYYISKEDKAEYASTVLSHLRGKNIVWDEFSKVPFFNNNDPYDSPLYFILQQPSLKYAWWLILFTVIIYVVFATKRMQRAIPVLELKTNTSLEYIKMISSLHFQNGNNVDMARKKMKYFLYFIRSKYGIHAQPFTEAHIKKLAEKSKVKIEDIEVIFNQYNLIEKNASAFYNIEGNRLADFYNSIEHFYKTCK
jgi:hypothetical protein